MFEVKERPILFNGEMVRAILDGRKTVTRRVLKPQPDLLSGDWRFNGRGWEKYFGYPAGHDTPLSPYGRPGDLLYVRETWGAVSPNEYPAPIEECFIEYRADLPPGCTDYPGRWPAEDAKGNPDAPKWKPSIHMPKWAARIWLRVKDVRVCRLWEMSELDMNREGVASLPENEGVHALTPFIDLWNQINGRRGYPWESNPFVWVVEFEVVAE